MLRKLLCLMRCCPFTPMSNERGCWGQCTRCPKRSGFVSSETLRRYLDAEAAHQATKEDTQT